MSNPEDARKTLQRVSKYLPKLAVSFPQTVCVHNAQLNCCGACLTAITLILIIGYCISNMQMFLMRSVPEISVHPVSSKWPPDYDVLAANDLVKPYIQDLNKDFARSDTENFKNVGTSSKCGTGTSKSCLYAHEVVQTHGETIFVPTFYTETYRVRSTNGLCQNDFICETSECTVCIREGSYYVPAAGDMRVAFNHEFAITPETTGLMSVAQAHYRGHSNAYHARGGVYNQPMLTVLLGQDAEEVKRFTKTDSSILFAAINMTLDEVISYAWYSGYDTEGKLSLDSTQPDLNGARLRMTGATITIDLDTQGRLMNAQPCYRYDGNTPSDGKKTSVIEWKNLNAPITCMFINAEQGWTYVDSVTQIGEDGQRKRRTFGFKFQFRKMGSFDTLDMKMVTMYITIFLVWMTVPLQLAYFFSINCLSTLGNIYGEITQDTLNLKHACLGLMTRIVAYSAAFKNLVSHKEESVGISKQMLRDRYRGFLSTSIVSDSELARYVEVVYEGMMGVDAQGGDNGVDMKSFVEACMTNEHLSLEQITKLVSLDRQRGFFEKIFMDKAASEVYDSIQKRINQSPEESSSAVQVAPQGMSAVSSQASVQSVMFDNTKDETLMSNLQYSEEQVRQNVDLTEQIVKLLRAKVSVELEDESERAKTLVAGRDSLSSEAELPTRKSVMKAVESEYAGLPPIADEKEV